MVGDSLLSILRRLTGPGEEDLAPEVAEALLQIRLSESDQARIGELAVKSNDGTLTPEEAGEYDAYIAAADVLCILQAKARMAMKQHPSAA